MGIIRRTKSVKTLLNAFEQKGIAISSADLVERFYSIMNKTTVYRILQRLEDDGALHSFIGKDGLRWYALNNGNSYSHHLGTHPHFQCKYCGKTECLNINTPIPELTNYNIESVSLLMVGKCSECLALDTTD